MLFRTLTVLAAVAASPLSAQSVLRVDASGGGDFLDLPAAVAAALSGDTILIANGSYGGVTIDKPLQIVADGPSVSISSTLVVENIATPDHVLINGPIDGNGTFAPALTIRNCSGTIWVDCFDGFGFLGPMMRVTASTQVVLVDCTGFALQSVGLSITDSSAFVQGGDFTGGRLTDGFAGASVSGSTVDFVGTSFQGGGGANSTFAGPPGNGGPGLSIVGGSVVTARAIAASGGSGGFDPFGPPGANGPPTSVGSGSTLDAVTGPLHLLGLDQVARVGGPLDYCVTGPSGHLIALNLTFDPDPFYLGIAQGAVVTGVPPISIPLGAIPSSGVLVVPTTLAPLGGPSTVQFYAQIVALDPALPAAYTGFARPITLLASGF